MLKIASIAGMCWLAFGCQPQSSSEELVMWVAGREGEVVSAVLPEFEASHPGLHVHVQQLPWRSAHEKFLTAAVARRAPDVAQLGNTWIPEFATIAALEPLDEELAASPSLAPGDYFSGAWGANEFAGHMYGVPWYVDTRLLFYRTDLLQAAGFERAPRTWDEWLTMLRAIQLRAVQQKGQGPPPAALFLRLDEPELLLALGLQQEPLLRDGDRYGNFQSPGFRRALDFYVSLSRVALTDGEASSQIANLWDEFGRGSFTSFISGPWQLGELARRLPAELQGSWSTAQLPGRDGPGASLALGASLVVFAGSKHKAAAWQLIEYLSRPDVQRRFYDLTGDLPPRRSSWEGSELASQRGAAAFRAQLEQLRPTPAVPEWQRISSTVTVIEERAARGALAPAAAAVELDRRTDRILEKRRWILEQSAAPVGARQ
jgi:multiple sugar transport system substrate-binding protein